MIISKMVSVMSFSKTLEHISSKDTGASYYKLLFFVCTGTLLPLELPIVQRTKVFRNYIQGFNMDAVPNSCYCNFTCHLNQCK